MSATRLDPETPGDRTHFQSGPKRVVTRSTVAIAFAAAAIGLLAAFLITFVPISGDEELPILVGLTGVVLAIPIVIRVAIGRVDPFEPVVCFVFVWALMFILKPLEILATGDSSLRDTFDVRPGLVPASVLGLIGATVFLLTYEIVLRRRRQRSQEPIYASMRSTPDWSRQPPPSWLVNGVIGLCALGMLTLAGASLTEIAASGSSAYQYLIPLLATPAILLLLLRSKSGSRAAAVGTAFLVVSSISFFVLYGQRAFILLPISAVFIYIYLSQRKRPRWAVLGLISLLVVVPIFTVIEVARENPEQGLTAVFEEEDIASPRAALDRFASGDSTAMFSALALQMSTEGAIWDQKPGSEPISIVTRFVPKSLWPDKPRSSSEELYSKYFPAHYELNRAGTLFTLVSEFYYDSGIFGVIVGMSLVGWAYARLWLWVIARPRDPWRWAMYAPVWISSTIAFRGDLALTFGLGLFVFGPLLLGLWISRRRVPADEGLNVDELGAGSPREA
ncbi:MAG TPA: O-antigen polymerase [Solirubrobacterales bacterium]|nr:O-antigen polymerase [Solirubrobacterales bacterium]